MILMKDIIMDGHPTLRLKAKDVSIPLTEEDKKTIHNMMEYLEVSQDDEQAANLDIRPGVGLAAPQINVSKKIFCILTYDEQGKNLYRYAFINPKIISTSIEKTYLPGGEGCLSVDPNTVGVVIRYKKIKMKGYIYNFDTLQAESISLTLKGYPGIVFQHEYDHLQGILFTDKMTTEYQDIEPIKFAYSEDNE